MKLLLSSFFILHSAFASAAVWNAVHPDAVTWRSNLVSIQASSANTTNHFYAVNALTKELSTFGVYQKMYYVNPRAGDDYLACLLAIKTASGLAPNENNLGSFASGDYTPSTGLAGNGTKYSSTRVNLRSLSASTNNHSMWITAYTTQNVGTTAFLMGASDGANQATGVGLINGGRLETGFSGASASAMYPYGLTNKSHTGFLGVNVKSFDLFVTNGSVRNLTDLQGVQGIAFDGTSEYDIDSARIYKRNYESRTVTAENLTPFVGATVSIAGGNHLGDGGYYNGYLYIGAEAAAGTDTTITYCSNHCIAIYDASNLQLSNTWSVAAEMPEISCTEVDPANGVVYAMSYYDSNYVYKYSLTTGQFQGRIQLSPPIIQAQGLAITNSFLFVSSDVVVVGGSSYAKIFAVDLATGTVQKMVSTVISGLLENEGLMVAYTNLVLSSRHSSTTNSYSFPIHLANRASAKSQTYWRDLGAYGPPELSTSGLANYASYIGGGNNTDSPAVRSSRRMGDTYIGQGLTDAEAHALGRASIRMNIFLGRR